MKYTIRRLMLLITILSGLTLACGAFFGMPQLLPGTFGDQTGRNGETSVANGERIYFTATNSQGERTTYRGGARFGGMMMGTALTCASCHGPDARGGTHFMHMQVMDAPDITYVALSGEADGHDEDAHGDDHSGYSLEDFRKAVIDGQHPDGDSLSRDMPRWRMSDQDLADLLAFLMSIQ